MIAAKVLFKNAEEIKRLLLNKGLMDFNYKPIRKNDCIIFPVNKKFENKFVEFTEEELPKKEKKENWKDELEKNLSKKEFESLIAAHDIVGTIAILEIPDELEKKEKLIADTLLKHNKNVKTVLKKAGEHSGTFRTQKMKWLAGEKTKEAIHKENNVNIKLNVEEVFFSSRLSTERKRISEQIKKDENILVMFSGCAPYVCVFAKNSSAKRVMGIELNPEGHKYGIENMKLNKLHNVSLINEDVKIAMPRIHKQIVGLKSARLDDEMETRMVHKPKIMEFHLFTKDLFEDKVKLEKKIKEIKEKGLEIILHMPFRRRNDEWYSFAKKDIREELEMIEEFGKLCVKYKIKGIVHPTYKISKKEDRELLINNLKKLRKYYDYFYFENEPQGIYSKTEDILDISKKAGIKNICIDTAHLYIVYEDNNKIEEHIKKIQKEFNTYFHLNDHDKKSHSCGIGEGFIDFEKILPYVNKGIAEIRSNDEKNPIEMIESYNKLVDIIPKFDRISMQLPKNAADFLPEALSVAKKGTIIHFYDFRHEDEFDETKKSVEKACKKAGLKFKFLNFVKCGQFSPRKHRVCLDLKII